MITLESILKYLDIVGPLLGLAWCFTQKGKRAGGYLFIIAFLCVQLLANGFAKYLMIFKPGYNIYVYKINTILSLPIILTWFLQQFKPVASQKMYKILLACSILCVLILLILVFMDNKYGLNSLSYSFLALCICICCLLYYQNLLTHPRESNELSRLYFWIVTGFFFYFSVCFFIFAFYNSLTRSLVSKPGNLWLFHNLILCISCCVLAMSSKLRPKWAR